MKIINTYNLTNYQNHNSIQQKQKKYTSEEITGKDFKSFSNAITALNKALITFKAKKPAPDKQTLLRLLEEGKSESEMAEIMGEDVKRIHTALLKYGLIKTNRNFIAKNESEIKRLLLSGKTSEEVAETLGCSISTISNAKEKFGINYKSLLERNKDNIIRTYREGKTQKQIADIFGCHQTGISGALKRWGIESRPTIKDNYKDIVIEMYQNGSTQQEIADILDCSASTVKYILSTEGIEFRPLTNIEHIKDEIMSLYEQGTSIKEIGRITGYAPSSINNAVQKWGIRKNNYVQRGTTELYKDKIIEMKNNGFSYSKIAREIGCSTPTIQHALMRWGIVERSGIISKNNLMEANKDFILELHNEGADVQTIADILNCDRSTISKAFKNWGVEIRGSITERNKEKILEMYEEGMPVSKIAKVIGCSSSGVFKALKRWGEDENSAQ